MHLQCAVPSWAELGGMARPTGLSYGHRWSGFPRPAHDRLSILTAAERSLADRRSGLLCVHPRRLLSQARGRDPRGREEFYDRGDQCPYLLLCAPPMIGNRTLGFLGHSSATTPTSPDSAIGRSSDSSCSTWPSRTARSRVTRELHFLQGCRINLAFGRSFPRKGVETSVS